MGEDDGEFHEVVSQQLDERSHSVDGEEGEGQPQDDVHDQAQREDAVDIVLKEFMVPAPLPDVPHDLAIHASVQHQGVDPASFDN